MLAAWISPGDAHGDTFDPPPVDRSEGGTGIPGQHGISWGTRRSFTLTKMYIYIYIHICIYFHMTHINMHQYLYICTYFLVPDSIIIIFDDTFFLANLH